MAQYAPMYDNFHQSLSDSYVPSARMSVSANVFLPGSDVDIYTGQLKPDHQRRRRTQGKRLERERIEREQKRLSESVNREMSKGGIRVSVRSGILIFAVLLFVCCARLLYREGQIAACQKEINRLESTLTALRNQNQDLTEQVTVASDEAAICYAASHNLGMVPASSVKPMHLEAVDTRPLLAGAEWGKPKANTLESPSASGQVIASSESWRVDAP